MREKYHMRKNKASTGDTDKINEDENILEEIFQVVPKTQNEISSNLKNLTGDDVGPTINIDLTSQDLIEYVESQKIISSEEHLNYMRLQEELKFQR